MQLTPLVSRSDVERVGLRDFPSADPGQLLSLLDQYGEAKWELEGRDRVHLAALKLADGDLDALQQQLIRAKQDFRDVVADAEYPRASANWSVMATMSEEDRQQVYDADWKDYQVWLRHL